MMMKTASRITAAAMAVFLWDAGPAAAQGFCTRGDMEAHLRERFNEHPVAQGVAANGSLIVITADANGAFTVFITVPATGLSCIVASGHDWETLSRPGNPGDPA